MSEHTISQCDPQDERARRIQELVKAVVQRITRGERVSIDQVIASNSDLMPEIDLQLKKAAAKFDDISDSDAIGGTASSGTLSSASDDSPHEPDSDFEVSEETSGNRNREAPRNVHIDGYRDLTEIGRGGQGVVYSAKQDSTGLKVAIKVLYDGPLTPRNQLARLEREIRILANMNHPNLVRIVDSGMTASGYAFLVMEHINGQPLSALFKDQLPPGETWVEGIDRLKLFLRIVRAVQRAHVRSIIHRDLKPSNILVDPLGEPHIVDFGLARAEWDLHDNPDHAVTVSGRFIGSLPWASPEQANGRKEEVDARSDIYSLGVILYQLVTGGRFPYKVVGTMKDVLDNILRVEPTPPSRAIESNESDSSKESRRPVKQCNINPGLEAIVLKALAKSPDARYQTAADLAFDIDAYIKGRTTRAELGIRKAERARLRLIGVVAALALVSVVAAVAINKSAAEPKPEATTTSTTITRTVPNKVANAASHNAGVANHFVRTGDYKTALTVIPLARQQYQSHVYKDPSNVENTLRYVGMIKLAAKCHERLMQFDSADEEIGEAITALEKYLILDQQDTQARMSLAQCFTDRARVQLKLARLEDADVTLRSAIRLLEELIGERHSDGLKLMLLDACNTMADLMERVGRPNEATAMRQRMDQIRSISLSK